jgi:hypothetical protein
VYQIIDIEWFNDVIVRALSQSMMQLFIAFHGRQNQDGHHIKVGIAPESPADLKTGGPRKHDIEDQQVAAVRFGRLGRILARGLDNAGVSGIGEILLDILGCSLIVFHYENGSHPVLPMRLHAIAGARAVYASGG